MAPSATPCLAPSTGSPLPPLCLVPCLSPVISKDAAFLLTVGSFLLTVELFYLQLTIFAFLLTVGIFFLTYIFSFFTYSWSFFAYRGKVRLTSALRDCKQRSLTVSKKAPTVSKQATTHIKEPIAAWPGQAHACCMS